jgi:hypothetical protein
MSMIAKFFEVSLLTSIQNNAKFSSPAKCYYFSVESPQKLSKVITYFEKYPLIGIKGLDYKDNVFVYTMVLNKGDLTDKGRETIKRIVTGMSNRPI